MKKINNTLIFIFSIASFCFFIKDLNIGATDRLLADITVVITMLLLRIFKRIFKLKISYEMEFVYIIFISLAHFFGSVVNLYNKIWWYDLFAHFLSGILTAILALVIMNYLSVYKEKNKLFNVLFIISFTLMVASIWEFFEYGADTFLGLNVQHAIETGVSDTMEDMLVAFLGSVIVSIFYLIEYKIKNGFIKRIVNSLG